MPRVVFETGEMILDAKKWPTGIFHFCFEESGQSAYACTSACNDDEQIY